jgi:hypothetical protein
MSRILPIELKEFDATTLNGTDQNFGTALANPAIKITVFNTGNTDVYIGITGESEYLRVPAYGTMTLDESTLYFRGIDQEYYLRKGEQLTLTQESGPSTAGGNIIAHVVTRRFSP